MELDRSERVVLREEHLECTQIVGEPQVVDLQGSMLLNERPRDVRRENRFDPSTVHAGNPAERPPGVEMREFREAIRRD